jgi:riboflavin kinase / FMN adenylyltransferase
MLTFRKLEEIQPDFGPTVISVGNFDGVHLAHRLVLERIVERAKALGGKSLVVTFDPHPTRVLRPERAPKLLTPLSHKLALLAESGIDATLVLPFSAEFAKTSPRDFASGILGKSLRAAEVHEGFNFHFGHKAEGNVARLMEFGREASFKVVEYPEMRRRGNLVSSSRIRELVLAGDMSRARALLGRSFSIVSTPAHGRGYGSKYTVPTINLATYEELVPKNGVYVTKTRVGSETFRSVTNVGNRPTFGADSFAIESHLLDFHPIDLTEQTPVEVCFLRRLRDEQKFANVEMLKEQIARDVATAERFFRLL